MSDWIGKGAGVDWGSGDPQEAYKYAMRLFQNGMASDAFLVRDRVMKRKDSISWEADRKQAYEELWHALKVKVGL